MLGKKSFCGNLKHSRWSSRCRFVAYVAPPADSNDQGLMGEWAERLQYISNDLHWLLQLPHQQFWCQVRKIIIIYAANFIYTWDCVLSNTKVRGGILKYHVYMAVSVITLDIFQTGLTSIRYKCITETSQISTVTGPTHCHAYYY